ncbi:hypothetical protein BGZ76_006271 [Entomortierella beljakovae]|nr:hypothetical protein BGZ76_006271 [Entomortierella beljakovae]
MKAGPFTTFVSAVVLSASVLGAPMLFKQLTLTSRMAICYATVFTEGKWSDDCASDTSLDFGLITVKDIHSLDVDFSTPDHNSVGLSSPGVDISVFSFPGFSWPLVEEISQSVIFEYNGVDIGRFENPNVQVLVTGNIFQTPINPTTLHILNMEAFVSFATAMFQETSVDVKVRGVYHGSFYVPVISTIKIPNIAFSSPCTLPAGDGLSKASLIRLDSSARDGTGMVINVIEFSLHNPSRIAGTFGDVKVRVTDKSGAFLGIGTLKALRITIGDNKITAVLLSPEPIPTDNQVLTLSGYDGSSQYPISNAVIKLLKITISI